MTVLRRQRIGINEPAIDQSTELSGFILHGLGGAVVDLHFQRGIVDHEEVWGEPHGQMHGRHLIALGGKLTRIFD